MGFACDCIAAKMGPMRFLMSLLVCAGLWGQSGLRKIGDLGAGAEAYVYTDTANVNVIRQGERAMLIDVGDGGVLAELPKIGVKQLEWVLFTHHHREQVQGAAKLKDWNVKVAVPEAEREFFENPMAFRKMKASLADRFAVHGASYLRVPRERIAVDRGFAKMDDFEWGGLQFHCVETKGNSPGAMSYLVKTPTGWVAFVGDLIVDGARMHTWFDTEWDYGFAAGIFPLVESAALIEQFDPVLVAPSHGPMIRELAPSTPLAPLLLATFSNALAKFGVLAILSSKGSASSAPASGSPASLNFALNSKYSRPASSLAYRSTSLPN